MTNFKIGDIVEVDWNDHFNYDVKHNDWFQGKIEVTGVSHSYLYFKKNGRECSGFLRRFKLVTPAKESKQVKKPHAWAVVNVHNGSIRCVKNTRGEARQIKQNLRMIAITQVKKVFLEFAE